jgi:hypothetical protein
MPYCSPVGVEDEVDFLDRDLVRQHRQLVEDLPVCRRVAAERLRKNRRRTDPVIAANDSQFLLIEGEISAISRLWHAGVSRSEDLPMGKLRYGTLFEQIVERLTRAVGPAVPVCRSTVARREQGTEVLLVLRSDAGRIGCAFEAGARVE